MLHYLTWKSLLAQCLVYTLGGHFFSVAGGFKQLCHKWLSTCFLNTRDVMGFVGNSYKVVNTTVKRYQLFGFFPFIFFFLKKNPIKLGSFIIGWLGPAPDTDHLSSCEGQQSANRQQNNRDSTIYFDHAKALEGQAGKYCCCKLKDIEYLGHPWLLLNLAGREQEQKLQIL